MNFPSLRLALVAGLALPFALAGASSAQDGAAPPPPPSGADAAPHRHHVDPAEMRAHMADHLRTALQLQPGQDGALNTYLDSMKPPQGMRGRGGERGDMQHLTTPERLDRMATRMDERRARLQTMIAATRQFYAQLSPAQQKAFDDLGPHMMGGRGGGRMGGGRMGGPGRWGRGGADGMGPEGSPSG